MVQALVQEPSKLKGVERSLSNRRSVFWGLLLVAAGVIWFLNNLQLVSVDMGRIIAAYWPVLLLAWGADILVDGFLQKGKTGSGFVNGIIILALGALLLGHTLNYYRLDLSLLWKVLWPALIIIIGINILLGGRAKTGNRHFAVMSGLEYKSPGWKLESGDYIVVMGGVDLDLTVADIPEGDTYLHLLVVMGGVDIKIPADLQVECGGTAFLGGIGLMKDSSGGIFGSKRMEKPGAPGKKLIVTALVVAGGIDIK